MPLNRNNKCSYGYEYIERAIAQWRSAAEDAIDPYHRSRLFHLANQLADMPLQPHGAYMTQEVYIGPDRPRTRKRNKEQKFEFEL